MIDNQKKGGYFIISIDFELNWGVLDRKNNSSYHENILKGRNSFGDVIDLLAKNNVNATVATVGLLFNKNKNEMIANSPDHLPNYTFENGSPFPNHILEIGKNETEDPIHFGYSIIENIKKHPNLEIGTHTYSHYYSSENGHSQASFNSDLNLAISVAKKNNVSCKSIVFPRNQINEQYLEVCYQNGIKAYRGNENSWVYQKGFKRHTGIVLRTVRALDAYINLTGKHTHPIPISNQKSPINIPASSFLRPIRFRSKIGSKLKIKRIKKAMKKAAVKNEIFHLWWHPHNFGRHEKMMINELKEVLQYFEKLNLKYGMESKSMGQLADIINEG